MSTLPIGNNVQVENEGNDTPVEFHIWVNRPGLDITEALLEEPEGQLAWNVETAADAPNEAIHEDVAGELADDGENENAVDAVNNAILTPFGLEVIQEDVEGELADDGENEDAVDAVNEAILTPFGLEVIQEDVEGELADDGENEDAVDAVNDAITPFGLEVIQEDVEGEQADDGEEGEQ